MRYQEYQPPIELAPWIKLFWVFENRSNDPLPETIVTDGFPELIIHFRSPFAEIDQTGQFVHQPTAVACGQLTQPLVLQSSHDAGMIGIRFQPNGMAPFLATPMHRLTNTRVPVEELFADIEPLLEEINDSPHDSQRIAACNRFLRQSLRLDHQKPIVQGALEGIRQSRGEISIESLATEIGTSRRSLELAFKNEVGTSPKMYCRIARFRHLLDTLSGASPNVTWVQTALDSGFFDQSHLIRDFRQFTGRPPTAFLATQTSFTQSVNQAP